MIDYLKWIPLVNTLGLVFGYVYAMLVIKMWIAQLREDMRGMLSSLKDHEKRLAYIEGRLSISHREDSNQ